VQRRLVHEKKKKKKTLPYSSDPKKISFITAYKAWCQAKGILYKDPEKYAAEKSLATAIISAHNKGRKGGRGTGNGFRSRGNRGRTGPQRNTMSGQKSGRKQQSGGRGSWQKSRGGKTSNNRGKPANKRVVGNNEQKD
jgi:hypothetical protein